MYGNELAWQIYEGREEASEADLAFAVEVGRKAMAAAPEDPNVIDTLACCLSAVGEREEALTLVRRCIELEPENGIWKDRLAELSRE